MCDGSGFSVGHWAQSHLSDISKARDRFDQRAER
jgi:hypothetical protein